MRKVEKNKQKTEIVFTCDICKQRCTKSKDGMNIKENKELHFMNPKAANLLCDSCKEYEDNIGKDFC